VQESSRVWAKGLYWRRRKPISEQVSKGKGTKATGPIRSKVCV
jgi:hypothetical protein